MPPSPAPTHSPDRAPGRRSFGPAVGVVAARLGTPLMPWQQHVADVAGELDEHGRPWWRTVVLTVPRQAGKSSLLRAWVVTRCLMQRRHLVWMTAQTRQDAADRFGELVEAVEDGPLGARFKSRLSNGSERLRAHRTGSTVRIFAPKAKAIHGNPADLIIFDEAWAHSRELGQAMMQAVKPTGNTRPQRQLWIVSTAGTAESTWLRDYVDRGRGGEDRLAYLEWSSPSDELADIIASHPAVGHTTDEDAIVEALADMPPGEFGRAYGNRWTGAAERVWPADVWAAVQTDARPAADAPAAVAVDVAPDHTSAAVAVAWLLPDGTPCAAVVAHGPGTAWVCPAAEQLAERHGTSVVWDSGAAAAAVADGLGEDTGRRPLQFPAVAQAAQQLHLGIVHRRLRLVADPALTTAAEGLARRDTGDQWTWARRDSVADITPLVACDLALWALAHADDPPLLAA